MPRPRNAVPGKRLHIVLPGSTGLKLDLYLFSPVEGRIPAGSHALFLTRLVEEFFSRHKELSSVQPRDPATNRGSDKENAGQLGHPGRDEGGSSHSPGGSEERGGSQLEIHKE
jgi:hypothetical protein